MREARNKTYCAVIKLEIFNKKYVVNISVSKSFNAKLNVCSCERKVRREEIQNIQCDSEEKFECIEKMKM